MKKILCLLIILTLSMDAFCDKGIFIGIAGGSGSGKTTLARKIIEEMPSLIVLISQDSYYLDTLPPHLTADGRANYDHPDAFDWALMIQHLEQLKNGQQVAMPIYDFKIGRRLAETEMATPKKFVIIEGMFTLWHAKIRELLNLKVFVDVPADVRFIRRLKRDIKERGREANQTIEQYFATVRPMHNQFLSPTQQFADLVVGEQTDIAAAVIATHFMAFQNTGS